MSLKIKYSFDLEKQRLKNTLGRFAWYERMKYRPRFPAGTNPKKDKLRKIHTALQSEYDETDYKKAADVILKEFAKIEADFSRRLLALCGLKLKKTYNVILTKYGVGGSYGLPNNIILNINSESKLKTILHEIIHLAVEKYILKYKIEQNQKERIVDLILTSKEFAKFDFHKQARGETVAKTIDPLFKICFKRPVGQFFKRLDEQLKVKS